jgi:Na+/H+ antiporter NhaD/arsenite permease-like protein
MALLLTVAVIALVFRGEFSGTRFEVGEVARVRVDKWLMGKSLAVSAAMVVFFLAGWPVAQTAMVAGAALLVTRRVKPEKVYHDIDWPLLAMFAGLFIVVAGVEKTSLEEDLFAVAAKYRLDRVGVLSFFSFAASNLVSNVPAVLIFRPVVSKLADPATGWLTLAMSSTLAGNFTVLASVANLIVLQRARHEVRIGFWDYFKAGAPLTALSIAFGVWWIGWVR